MYTLSHPDDVAIRAHLERQAALPFSHHEVGATQEAMGGSIDGLISGSTVDHNRVRLGTGDIAFERARQAIRDWKMFDVGWLELCWPSTPTTEGSVVGILVRIGWLWSLSACRIVYTIDEEHRFGFGYGTLPDHAEVGEERFLVERDPRDGSIWYDLLAFSRPRGLAASVGKRYARALQQRFARHSMRAMVRSTG